MPYPWKAIAHAVLAGESLAAYAMTRPLPEPTVTETGRTATLMLAENGRVIVRFAYSKFNPADVIFKDELKKAVDGLTWEGEPYFRWTVGIVALPKLIAAFGGKKNIFASDDVKALYQQEIARRHTLDVIRTKVDSDIEIPTLVPLYPYQKVGVEFVDRAGGRALVADQMGLGKTATAIGYAVKHNLRTLVVCPKSVMIGWTREIQRFAGEDSCVWQGSTPLGDVSAKWHVINYDIVDKNLSALLAQKFDLLVCDEATYLKNHKAKRSKAIMGSWKERKTYPGIKTDHVILLTGTPVLNRPIEAFQLLRFLSKDRFGNVMAFMEKYGRAEEKPRNLDELHERTKDLMIRRLKKDVRPDMPAKRRDDLEIELPSSAMKEYNKILDGIFRKWNSLGSPSAAQMPAIQKFLLPYKLERTFEFIDEMLASEESVLIFSQYRDPIFQIQQRYGTDCGIIMGGMSSTDRQKTVDDLRAGRKKVGAFTINAASMGIDGLQHKISTVLFLDRWWVPSVHEQAEDRLHRDGQKETVQVYYLTCKDTIDEDMAAVLTEKQEIIDKVVDGQVVEQVKSKSFFKEFITRLRKRKSKQMEDLSDPTDDEFDVAFDD